MSKQKRIFPAGALVSAAWVLANPNVTMIDLIPDCIAFAFILYALRHISSFAPYMQEATDNFRKLFYVTLFKLPALFIMLSMTTQRVTITLFSLSFAIVELFFLIPAFNALFEGFYYLGSRFGCEAALRETPKKPEAIHHVTLLFLIVKHALSTLPDFLFLFEYDPLTGEGITFTNAQYAFVQVLAFIITLIFAIIWLSYILPYLRAIAKDKGTASLKSPDCKDPSARENVRLRLSLPYILFGAAICFSVDMVVDNVNLLPDFLAATCFFGLALFFYLYAKRQLSSEGGAVSKGTHPLSATVKPSDPAVYLPVLTSLLYLVSTVLFSIFRTHFYNNFQESDLTAYNGSHSSYLPINQEALAAYLPVNITSVISELLFVLCVMLSLHTLYLFAKVNTKTAPPHTTVEERFLFEELKTERKQSILCFVLSCLSAIVSTLHVFLLRFNAKEEMQPGYGGTLYLPKSGAFWLVTFAISLLLAAFAVWLSVSRVRKLFKANDVVIERYSSLD